MIYYLKIEHINFLIPSIKCTMICYSTLWESLISLYFVLLELFSIRSGLQRSWRRYTHERRVELFLRSCWTWLPGIDFVCQLLVNSVNTFTMLSMAMEKNCELGSYSDSSLTEKDKYWHIIGNPRPASHTHWLLANSLKFSCFHDFLILIIPNQLTNEKGRLFNF